MSIRIEHRLRKKCKNEETPSTFSKSLSNSAKKCSSVSLSSSSSSSPHISDIVIEKNARRKKIRSTQDFNILSSSLTLVDSNESTKPKSKKTKKNKILYSLPKIAQVAEDIFAKSEETCDTNYGELMPKKRGRKKSSKQNGHSQEGETNFVSKQYIGKNKVTEERKSANSTSDSGRDSEVEIITKDKRLKNKKKVLVITSIPRLQKYKQMDSKVMQNESRNF